MPYEALLAEGRLRPHRVTRADVDGYLAIADSRLSDAALAGLSADGRFAFAYDAIRSAAQAVMATEGYRTASAGGHHAALFDFLAETDSGRWEAQAAYFDDARKKRNVAIYESFGQVTETESDQLLAAGREFVQDVREWVATRWV